MPPVLRLLSSTALAGPLVVSLATIAAAATTIPDGPYGDAVQYAPYSGTDNGCPCGGGIRIGATSDGANGSWKLSAGARLESDAVSGTATGEPFSVIGKGTGSVGTLVITGAGSQYAMLGNGTGAALLLGRDQGTATLEITDGGALKLTDYNNPGYALVALKAARSGSTANINMDNGSLLLETNNGASFTLGTNDDKFSSPTGSTSTLSMKNGSVVTVHDTADNAGPQNSHGATFQVGGTADATATAQIDGSTLNVKSEDTYGSLAVAQAANSTGTMTLTNGATVNIQSGSFGSTGEWASLRVGGSAGAQGTVNVDQGSTVALSGPHGWVALGAADGATGSLRVAGGSKVTYGGPDGYANIGQYAPTTGSGGSGSLVVTGAGSLFDMGTGSVDIGNTGGGSGQSSGVAQVEYGGTLRAAKVVVGTGGVLKGNAGTIDGSVDLAGGSIAPGASPGTMTITGDLTVNSGTIQIQLAGTGTTQYDHLIVNGDLIGSPKINLELSFLDGFLPKAGDVFDFLDVGGNILGGTSPFNITVDGGTPGMFALSNSGNSFSLTATSTVSTVPVPASMPLLGAGLLLLGGLAWRRRLGSA